MVSGLICNRYCSGQHGVRPRTFGQLRVSGHLRAKCVTGDGATVVWVSKQNRLLADVASLFWERFLLACLSAASPKPCPRHPASSSVPKPYNPKLAVASGS